MSCCSNPVIRLSELEEVCESCGCCYNYSTQEETRGMTVEEYEYKSVDRKKVDQKQIDHASKMLRDEEFDEYFLTVAELTSKLSYAKKMKVGSVLVKDRRIVLTGYNGSFPGTSNELEFVKEDGTLKTKSNVFHSEENLILYAAKNGIKLEGGTLYCTHSPCVHCARLIIGSGIKEVVYINEYKDRSGRNFLEENGVLVRTN